MVRTIVESTFSQARSLKRFHLTPSRKGMRIFSRMPPMKRTEDIVRRQYEAAGYQVYRNGWPDFLVVKDGVGFGVEVKRVRATGSGSEVLSDAQVDMQTALHKLGLSTVIS